MGYITVTEMPGLKATKENIDMLYTRYKWASSFVQGKNVVEVACGAGQGLGYLARKARKVVGGDVDTEIVQCAQDYYKGRVKIIQFDAERLPFDDASVDVVLLFEAIYYLKNPEAFVKECKRILTQEGLLLLCTANRDWRGFNPSPFAVHYFSVNELAMLLQRHGFTTEVFGAFKISKISMRSGIFSAIRRMAVKFHLIPKTMKGKALLKRILYGELCETPAEIQEGMAVYHQPMQISATTPNYDYKVVYVRAFP